MESVRRRRRRRRPAEAPTIGDLPNDVLAHILSFLPGKEAARTALLSAAWRHLWSVSPLNLSLNKLLSHRWDWDSLASKLPAILSRHRGSLSLLHIDLRDAPPFERRIVWERQIVSLCKAFESKRIQHLYFRGCSDGGTDLPLALISGSSLSTLLMYNSRFGDPAVALQQHLVNLRVLAMSGLQKLGEDFLSMISGLPMLLGLDLAYVTCPDKCDFHLQSKSLRRLRLSGLHGGGVLTIDAPNLQELHLSGKRIPPMDLEAIVSSLPKLHYLTLRYFHFGFSSTLCIRSGSLKRLVLIRLSPVKVFNTDTPIFNFCAS